MTDLRVGHDYHLAEIKTLRGAPESWASNMGRLLGFQAYCDACGWVGMVRTERGAALDDAAAHDMTENE